MIVLSLFDGISCGQVALERAGVKVNRYYASEIDKHAIINTRSNYPNTIQLGNILDLTYQNGCLITTDGSQYIDKIDLLIGGSPCQSFSSSGNQTGFNGASGLFFEYVRILKLVKPKYFLLENVVMKKEWRDIITQELGVEPILINSALVSAQNRNRYYWTNIPNVTQPKDKVIEFQDITKDDYVFTAAMRGRRIGTDGASRSDNDKSIPIQQYIEFKSDNKTNCLTTVSKDNVVTKEHSKVRQLVKDVDYRYLTVEEMEQLQTLPIGYTQWMPKTQRIRALGNGWTVDVIAHILKDLV